MAWTKPVARRQRHLHRRVLALANSVRQQINELQVEIDANGGEADAGIAASWANAEFRSGFKAVRDALKNFGP